MSADVKTLLTPEQRLELMFQLIEVVTKTGEHVQNLKSDRIFDTVEVARHQFSTVDAEASIKLRSVINDIPGSRLSTVLEESDIPAALTECESITYPLYIGDGVEGSTNAKRGLASALRRPILAGTSVMVLEDSKLGSIAASAFYDFASRLVFSSVRIEPGHFHAFVNSKIIRPTDIVLQRGDTQVYAIVPGYSHSNVEARAQTERALLETGIRTTGGSRSSAQDMIDIICNQAEAYVDLRALFSGSSDTRDAVLHPWDVGGLLPVLDGLGFMITDAYGQSWQGCQFSDSLALVVTRPPLGERILNAISHLPFVSKDPGGTAVSIPITRHSMKESHHA